MWPIFHTLSLICRYDFIFSRIPYWLTHLFGSLVYIIILVVVGFFLLKFHPKNFAPIRRISIGRNCLFHTAIVAKIHQLVDCTCFIMFDMLFLLRIFDNNSRLGTYSRFDRNRNCCKQLEAPIWFQSDFEWFEMLKLWLETLVYALIFMRVHLFSNCTTLQNAILMHGMRSCSSTDKCKMCLFRFLCMCGIGFISSKLSSTADKLSLNLCFFSTEKSFGFTCAVVGPLWMPSNANANPQNLNNRKLIGAGP